MEQSVENKPVKEIRVTIPKYLTSLDATNPIITHVIEGVRRATKTVKTMEEIMIEKSFSSSPYFRGLEVVDKNPDSGIVTYAATPHEDLYFRVLSELTGTVISSESDVLAYVATVSATRNTCDRLAGALTQMEETGYGIVTPVFESFKLEKPTLYQSGKNFGVKLCATGQSIHLIKVDVSSHVAPIIGEQAQSEEMLKFLQSEYENNPQTVWETPIFGKSLESIVREDIEQKAMSMPPLAKGKMQRTLTRVINNGKGGVICILL
ncbi:MAG: stage IV sporulation protein A [Firmicutes bacterium]|nr:stage IV sporulation protein A [Bacillota bacterium]